MVRETPDRLVDWVVRATRDPLADLVVRETPDRPVDWVVRATQDRLAGLVFRVVQGRLASRVQVGSTV